LQRPLKNWYWQGIVDIMDVCIILHNMIVEARRTSYTVSEYAEEGREWYASTDTYRPDADNNNPTPPPSVSLFQRSDDSNSNFLLQADLSTRMAIRVAHLNQQIKNQEEHLSLKNDLMNHLWQRHSRRGRQQQQQV
jgi:hypothetical protein